MELDNVNGPESADPADLLAAWRGQVRELESVSNDEAETGGELLAQMRAIADDLSRKSAQLVPQLRASNGEHVTVIGEAIAAAEFAPLGDDTVIASPLDLAALTAAIGTLEQAASNVLARAEGEFADVRNSVKTEVAAIRESLGTELKSLREEIQKSQRRASRRATDVAAPRILNSANETPVLAKLADACAHLEALRAQTERLAQVSPQPASGANADVLDELAQLQQFVEAAVSGLRQDLDTFAASAAARVAEQRESTNVATSAAEQAIAQLQSRVAGAAADADRRLSRLTSAVQSAAERAERSAAQVEAAYTATDALRAEATAAVGNWRDEALRIVRDALARMATETAGAASQAREARKTVIAETRTLRSELLKNAESAHAAVLAEVRRELEQTRAAFAEQRQQLAGELSALESARRHHEQLATASQADVNQALATAESTTRQEVERLDAAYRDLHTHLDEIRATNSRVVDAVERVEARASAELAPLAGARDGLEAARDQLVASDEQLRASCDQLALAEEQFSAATRQIAESNSRIAGAAEAVQRRIQEVEGLEAAYRALNAQLDEVRAANELVVSVAETVEARAVAELAPLDEIRQRSAELTAALQMDISDAVAELRQARSGLEEQREAALEAERQFAAATRRVDQSSDRIQTVADAVEQRVQNLEARAASELAPLAEVRERSEALSAVIHDEIGETLNDLRLARAEVEAQHRSALESVAATHASLSAEILSLLESARIEFAAKGRELSLEEGRLRAAITSVNEEAARFADLHDRLGASQERLDETRAELSATRERLVRAEEEMREQFGAALSAIAASTAESKADAKAQFASLARELRGAVEDEVREASRDIRSEFDVVVNALRDQLGRESKAEQELANLRLVADSKQAEDDGAALKRAVAMLSVLESLDDAVNALVMEPSTDARARIAHFERQAREMAHLVELEEIATAGELDEDWHEIVDVVAAPGQAGRIVEIRQRGYSFRGRVIRRAQVAVRAAGARQPRAEAASELRQ